MESWIGTCFLKIVSVLDIVLKDSNLKYEQCHHGYKLNLQKWDKIKANLPLSDKIATKESRFDQIHWEGHQLWDQYGILLP